MVTSTTDALKETTMLRKIKKLAEYADENFDELGYLDTDGCLVAHTYDTFGDLVADIIANPSGLLRTKANIAYSIHYTISGTTTILFRIVGPAMTSSSSTTITFLAQDAGNMNVNNTETSHDFTVQQIKYTFTTDGSTVTISREASTATAFTLDIGDVIYYY